MSKNDNYELLNVTIDTREKDTDENQKKNMTRMRIVSDFFEDLGACVDRSKVEYCDYAIEGTFIREGKPIEVCLGIQYKMLNGDFFPSLPKLPETLFRAFSVFKDVSLVVEENGHRLLLNEDKTDGLFQNCAMQASCEKTGTGLYSAYKNFMQSIAEEKIQARSIRNNEDFPIEICSILKYISKPYHNGLSIKPINFHDQLSNVFGKLPGVGPASVQHLLEFIPNIKSLSDCNHSELNDLLGPLHGKVLYQFLHNTERKNLCCNNWQTFYNVKNKGFTDILSMVKKKSRKLDEICIAFGKSQESVFNDLMDLKNKGQVYYDARSYLWKYGLEPNDPKRLVSEELNIGV